MKGYKFLYGLAQRMLSLTIRLLSPFHTKAAKIDEGRKHSLRMVQNFRSQNSGQKIFWFHAASVGEFEQALPVMQLLKKDLPEAGMVVSFFSPSGMEQKGKHPLIDLSFYLPADLPAKCDALLEALRPTVLVLVKYEFWFHLLESCRKFEVLAVSISCILREKQWKNPFLRIHLQHCLPHFRQLFVQNEETAGILRKMQLNNFCISGDTRIDRVLEIRYQAEELIWLKDWKGEDKLLIVGSAWPEDLAFLKEFIRGNTEATSRWRVLIVPHEIGQESLQQAEKVLEMKIPRFSSGLPEKGSRILMLDTTGMLSRAYRQADAAWIGGAFRTGLHNTLEAAVFGIPLGFGPKHAKFQEAIDLIRAGLASSFPEAGTVPEYFERQTKEENRQGLRLAADTYFEKRKGAATEISQYILHLNEGGSRHLKQ